MVFDTTKERTAKQRQEAARLERSRLEEQARKDQKERSIQAYERCLQSKEYKIREIEVDIVDLNKVIKSSQAAIAQNQKIERLSSTENPAIRYMLTSQLVTFKDSRDYSFSQYKRMGGLAQSPASVTVSRDVCVDLRIAAR